MDDIQSNDALNVQNYGGGDRVKSGKEIFVVLRVDGFCPKVSITARLFGDLHVCHEGEAGGCLPPNMNFSLYQFVLAQ